MNETPSQASTKFPDEGSDNDDSATLFRNIRRELSGYFERDRKKVVDVKIRRVVGGRIDGFLKVRSAEKHENFLLDFQATMTPRGTISSLEVDGKKVIIPSNRPKRIT